MLCDGRGLTWRQVRRDGPRVDGQVRPVVPGDGHLPQYAAVFLFTADALGQGQHDPVDDDAFLDVELDADAEDLLSLWCGTLHPIRVMPPRD